MMVEDRAGRGPQALQDAVYAMMGTRRADAGPAAGVLAVRDLDAAALSRHRPHQGAAARRQRAGRVRRAADLSRLVLRQRLQPVRPHLPRHRAGRRAVPRIDPKDVLEIRVRNSERRHRAARLVHDRARHLRALPRAALQSLSGGRARRRRGARLLAGPGDRDHGEARRRDAARRLRLRVDDARLPADCAPATPRSSPSCWRWCSCSWCWPRSTRA